MRSDQKVQYMRIANKLTAENYQSLLGKIMRINPDPPAFVEEVLPGIQEEMIRRRLNFPVEYMRSIYRDAALSDMPDREILKKLNVPTFILGVADDPNHPVAMAEELHRLIKNSELHILKNYTDVLCRKSIFQKFFEKFCTK
jgi:pimeloyl-ACP methyl ester carboxylesterase